MKNFKLKIVKLVCFVVALNFFIPHNTFARRARDIVEIPGRFSSVEDEDRLGLRGGPLSKHREEIKEVLTIRLIELIGLARGMMDKHIVWRDKLGEYAEAVADSLLRFKPGTLEQLKLAGIITEEIEGFLAGIDNFSVEDARRLGLNLFVTKVFDIINGYYENPLFQFTEEQRDFLLKRLISWQDIKWLMEDFGINKSEAMRAVMEYSNPREWLSRMLPVARQLYERYKGSKATFSLCLKAIKMRNPEAWLRNQLGLP